MTLRQRRTTAVWDTTDEGVDSFQKQGTNSPAKSRLPILKLSVPYDSREDMEGGEDHIPEVLYYHASSWGL